MTILKIFLSVSILLIILTGCDLVKTDKDQSLFNSIADLQHQIDNKEWDKALDKIEQLDEQYKHRKWKLQLLGEKEDYQNIEIEILSLQERLIEKDQTEAKITLIQILHRLNSIFEL